MEIIRKLMFATLVFLSLVAFGQPIVNNEFSVYQRRSVLSIFQEDTPKQVPIFAEKYKLIIPTNTSREIKISKDFQAICPSAKIIFSSSDPAAFSVSTLQQQVIVSARATGIEANATAIITAQCGIYYDSISVKAGV